MACQKQCAVMKVATRATHDLLPQKHAAKFSKAFKHSQGKSSSNLNPISKVCPLGASNHAKGEGNNTRAAN